MGAAGALLAVGIGKDAAQSTFGAAESSAQISKARSEIKMEQAAADEAAADRREARMREIDAALSAQRATFGAAGLDTASGSALAVQLADIENFRLEGVADAKQEAYAKQLRLNDRSVLQRTRSILPYAAALGLGSAVTTSVSRYQARRPTTTQAATTQSAGASGGGSASAGAGATPGK